MSISVTSNWQSNRPTRKNFFVFSGVAAFCVVFDRIYALFSHDVESPAMLWMFLIPLLLGAVPFLALSLFVKEAHHVPLFRLAENVWNTGIAVLTVRNALKGVFDIAGTHADALQYFVIIGWTAIGLGVFLFLIGKMVAVIRAEKNN